MDELEKKLPNDTWRKVFDEAAETPPPRVWDAIEHRLNEANDTRVLPLWGAGFLTSRPFVWGMGMAAAVALLLVGWWVLYSPQTGPAQPPVAATQQPNAIGQPVQPDARLAGSTGDASVNQPSASEAKAATRTGVDNEVATSPTRSVVAVQKGQQPSLMEIPESSVSKIPGSGSLPSLIAQTVLESGMKGSVSQDFPPASRITAATLIADKTLNVLNTPLMSAGESIALQRLQGKQLRMRGFGQIHRIVWFQPEQAVAQPETPQAKRKSRNTWASASVMPGAFNPMVSVQAVALGNSYALDALKGSAQVVSNTTRQVVNSRASFSMAYQAGAGVQLTDRWSVESGVGYLVGRSTVETPAQISAPSLTATNDRGTGGNLYVDALRSSSKNRDAMAYTAQSNFTNIAANNGNYLAVQTNYSDQSRKTLTNDYQFVQVPVQVGYELRPRKRLSLAVLGGLITNIFVKNTVDNEVEITAKDGVYRPVALAATVGARVRYRPPGQWSASMAGVYQPTLGTGTQSDSPVQSRPTSTGMSLGVDYHF